ncbi:hypothetical protein CYMTET_48276 [Cymbomonas tetramitiformis]|uniref:GUN4-like domain-containing protein n=1 Tax=Cymbomonas tetramitiformis TaxID=36881 RepID=A0AAE0BSQ3_9CHLO|nr:hypothetical protein CYMTET_48276 [Cymbomonas tetramitiformis]
MTTIAATSLRVCSLKREQNEGVRVSAAAPHSALRVRSDMNDSLSCINWMPRSRGVQLSQSMPSASGRQVFGSVRALATETGTVELNSEVGYSYVELEAALKEGDFEKADDITRNALIELAGEEAIERKFVYFTEVKEIPVKDLQTIDNLWVSYSDGNFGYSVQKKIWTGCKKKWGPFFKKLDWTTGENNAYRSWRGGEYIYKMDAAKGHLPLTSCLRGTQLLKNLFEHPAFETGKKGDSDGGAKPDWMKF